MVLSFIRSYPLTSSYSPLLNKLFSTSLHLCYLLTSHQTLFHCLFLSLYIFLLLFFLLLSWPRKLVLLFLDFPPYQMTDRSVNCSWGCFGYTLITLCTHIKEAQVCENVSWLKLPPGSSYSWKWENQCPRPINTLTTSYPQRFVPVYLVRGYSGEAEWTGLHRDLEDGIDGKPNLWCTGFHRDNFVLNNYLELILFFAFRPSLFLYTMLLCCPPSCAE